LEPFVLVGTKELAKYALFGQMKFYIIKLVRQLGDCYCHNMNAFLVGEKKQNENGLNSFIAQPICFGDTAGYLTPQFPLSF